MDSNVVRFTVHLKTVHGSVTPTLSNPWTSDGSDVSRFIERGATEVLGISKVTHTERDANDDGRERDSDEMGLLETQVRPS